MAKRTVGFIGLGIMGLPMAKNLLAAGYELVVHDINQRPVEELTHQGARQAPSAKDVAALCDVVITMLPDSPDVELVALGADGVMEGIRPGSVYVDMSTVSPAVAIRVAEAGKSRGVGVLDAPVSGGDVGARNATLSIMVGGGRAVFEDVLPIFQLMGKNIVLCGPNGAGQTVKACNQILTAVTVAGVSEALALGAKAGVDPAKTVQVLSGGLARCGILETRGERIVNRDFEPGFRGSLHYKDLRIVLGAAQQYAVALPVTALVHELFKRMDLSGRGNLDHTALVTILEEMSGIRLNGSR